MKFASCPFGPGPLFLAWVLAVLLGWTAMGLARAAAEDDILAARDAYAARDAARLSQLAARLAGHPLHALARYWQLSLDLPHAADADVREFLETYSDSHLADRLRAEWLKVLGSRQDWARFAQEYPRLRDADAEITCYALTFRLDRSPDDSAATTEAKQLWFTGQALPAACESLFAQLARRGHLNLADVHARLRLALEAGNVSVARHIARYLPNEGQGELADLALAANDPERFLRLKARGVRGRGGRELVLFAIDRLARIDLDRAVSWLTRLVDALPSDDRAYAWGRLALVAARRHEGRALDWFARAEGAPLSDVQLAWKARAALRASAWPQVVAAIDAMRAEEAARPEWRYWKARALAAQGLTQAAAEILGPLSRDGDYYGQLAREEVGAVITAPAAVYEPSEAEIQAIAARPAIQRALAFFAAGLHSEGVREWAFATRQFDDRALLSAARLARRHELYDRAIYSAERTRHLVDLELRYPTPHRTLIQDYVQKTGLDEAWVFGLIRQESRFVSTAKSSAGALGLMQLMPATARWVAKKLGLSHARLDLARDLDTNIALGTYYLKHVYDRLDGNPVLATAAYNAGPVRARRWQDARPLEGAIYVESIPLTETRDYVKKVLANASIYALRLEHHLTSLKARLSFVPARSENED